MTMVTPTEGMNVSLTQLPKFEIPLDQQSLGGVLGSERGAIQNSDETLHQCDVLDEGVHFEQRQTFCRAHEHGFCDCFQIGQDQNDVDYLRKDVQSHEEIDTDCRVQCVQGQSEGVRFGPQSRQPQHKDVCPDDVSPFELVHFEQHNTTGAQE
jgi:hypothetical protein